MRSLAIQSATAYSTLGYSSMQITVCDPDQTTSAELTADWRSRPIQQQRDSHRGRRPSTGSGPLLLDTERERAPGDRVVRVYVEVAGCERRQLDAESIRSYLEANGHELVSDPGHADRILAVTCAFKKKEEDESVRRLRSLRKYGREILVYGCLADIAAGRYTEFDDLPSIAPREIDTIDQHFEGITIPFAEVRDANVAARPGIDLVRARRRVESGMIPSHRNPWTGSASAGSNGANRRLPARGTPSASSYVEGAGVLAATAASAGPSEALRSKPMEDVLAEFHQGIDEGYRTFNIVGDDPGCYGLDISTSLPQLLGALFDASGPSEPDAGARSGGSAPIRFHIRDIHPKHLIALSPSDARVARFLPRGEHSVPDTVRKRPRPATDGP